jgi:hypothetical protein
LIHSTHPLIERRPLRAVLIGLLPLGLQNQLQTISEANQKVWPVLSDNALKNIKNLEAQMVVFGPSPNGGVPVEFKTPNSIAGGFGMLAMIR